MRRRLNDIYREAAKEFARRVVAARGDAIDAIVLYGSVARGEARRGSDIDVLVVSADPAEMRDRITDIRWELEVETNFSFLLSVVDLGREEFHRLVEWRWPLMREVLKEGVVLSDNGTFARVRQEAVAVG